MKQIRLFKERSIQKWHELPHHHRLAIAMGITVSFLLVIWLVNINLIKGRPGAITTDALLSPTPKIPASLIFRVIVENQEPKQLILRGTIVGSKGKVCFAQGENIESECPVEFPTLAWSRSAVRAKVAANTPGTGQVWLVTSEGVKSNQLEVSF